MIFSLFHLMPWTATGDPLPWPAPTVTFDAARAHALYEDYLACMAAAEDAGFDWLTCNEHHFGPYGLMPNPNLVAANLINRTKAARIAVCGNLVPILNPIRVAEEFAMLDVMSGGRLVAGFMRGVPHEYRAYSVDPSESWGRLSEAVPLILKCWTEDEPFSWHGEFYNFDDICIWPKPLQKPHPQIVLSGQTEESAVFAARHRAIMGVAFISDLKHAKRSIDAYRGEAACNGWEAGPEHILAGQWTVIADTDEEAHRAMRAAMDYFNTMLTGPLRVAMRSVIESSTYFTDAAVAQGFLKRQSELQTPSIDELIEGGGIFCGSPESVIKQMERAQRELGNGIFNLILKVGNLSEQDVYRSLRLFKTDVLPHVADLDAAGTSGTSALHVQRG